VDLVSKNGLKPLIRASVLEEARLLYAGMREHQAIWGLMLTTTD